MSQFSDKGVKRIVDVVRQVERSPSDGTGLGMNGPRWSPVAGKIAKYLGGNTCKLYHLVNGSLVEGSADETVTIYPFITPSAVNVMVVLILVDMTWVVVAEPCPE